MNSKIEIKVSEDIILELAADAAVPGDKLEMVLQFFKSIGQYETDHCGISVAGTLYTGWISAELLKDIILYGEGSLMLCEIMEKFSKDLETTLVDQSIPSSPDSTAAKDPMELIMEQELLVAEGLIEPPKDTSEDNHWWSSISRSTQMLIDKIGKGG